AVSDGVQELAGVPRCCQRAGFRLAVAHDAGDDQVRIVEYGSERMAEGVSQLAPLVDRSGALRGGMARNSTREGELREQSPQAGFVPADLRIDLAVSAFEVGVAHDRGTAVPRAGDKDHVEV